MNQIVKFQQFRDVAGPFNIYYSGSSNPNEILIKASASFEDLYYGYAFSYVDSPISIRVVSLDQYITQSSAYYYYPPTTTTTTTTTSTTTTTTTEAPTTTTSTTTSTTTATPTTSTTTSTTTAAGPTTTTTSTTSTTTTEAPTTTTTTSTTTTTTTEAPTTTTTSTTTTTTTEAPTTTTSTTTTTTTIPPLTITNGAVTCTGVEGSFTSTMSGGTTPYVYVAIDSSSFTNAVSKVNGVQGSQYQLTFSNVGVPVPEGGTWSNVNSTSGTWAGIPNGTWYVAVRDSQPTAAPNTTGVSINCTTTSTTTTTTTVLNFQYTMTRCDIGGSYTWILANALNDELAVYTDVDPSGAGAGTRACYTVVSNDGTTSSPVNKTAYVVSGGCSDSVCIL